MLAKSISVSKNYNLLTVHRLLAKSNSATGPSYVCGRSIEFLEGGYLLERLCLKIRTV